MSQGGAARVRACAQVGAAGSQVVHCSNSGWLAATQERIFRSTRAFLVKADQICTKQAAGAGYVVRSNSNAQTSALKRICAARQKKAQRCQPAMVGGSGWPPQNGCLWLLLRKRASCSWCGGTPEGVLPCQACAPMTLANGGRCFCVSNQSPIKRGVSAGDGALLGMPYTGRMAGQESRGVQCCAGGASAAHGRVHALVICACAVMEGGEEQQAAASARSGGPRGLPALLLTTLAGNPRLLWPRHMYTHPCTHTHMA